MAQLKNYLDNLPFQADGFQYEAIDALEQGAHVVVCAPTGSGKTLIAEAAAHQAIQSGGRLFYTTPLKALNNQKYLDFVKQYGAEKVGLLTGDCTINRDANIVVMTTEVFRNMLYGIEAEATTLADVGYVVLDECHFMNDPQRGTVWEESIIHCPQSTQIIALSATVANAQEMANWIKALHGNTKLIESHYRPVPLQHYFYVTLQNQLFSLFKPETKELNPLLKKYGFLDKKRARQAPFRSSQLIKILHQKEMLPAIFFTFSRKGCDRDLEFTSKLSLLSMAERKEVERQVDAFVHQNPILKNNKYLQFIKNGFASHHAGLLPVLKTLVESLFQQGLIKAVFATETLAAGINMPARTTVITSISKRSDDGHRLLTASEFLQMSGRAGRRGMDTTGYVVTVSSPYETVNEMALLARSKPEALNSQFTPKYGMVLNLLERFSLDDSEKLIAKSFGAYTVQRRLEPYYRELEYHQETLEDAVHFECPEKLSLEDFQKYLKVQDHLDNRYHQLNQLKKLMKQQPKNFGLKDSFNSEQSQISQLKTQLLEWPCKECELLKKHKKATEHQFAAQKRITKLNKAIDYERQAYWQQFLNYYQLLKAEGYITTDDKPTTQGQLMAQLRTENEYFLTEVILSNVLDDLSPAALSGMITALINDDNRERNYGPNQFSGEMNQALNKIHPIAKRVAKLQSQFHITSQVIVNPIASSFVERWGQGESWESITRNSSLDEGDLVRQLRRVADVLRQISRLKGVNEQLRLSAESAHYQIYRPPVAEVFLEAVADETQITSEPILPE